MYKYLLSIPLILFPYLLLFSLYCLLTGFLMAEVFANNGYILLLLLIAFALIAFVCSLVMIVLALVKKEDSLALARLNMVVKLCHVPAYIAIFILSVIFLLTVLGIGFVFVFAIADAFSIVMSGIYGAIAAWAGHRQNTLKTECVALGILQFVYCADVVACIVMYVKVRKGKRAQTECTLESNPVG